MHAKNSYITPLMLLESLLEEGEGIAIRILISMGLDIDKLYDEIKLKDKKSNQKLEIYNIGKEMSKDLSDNFVVGREKEIDLIDLTSGRYAIYIKTTSNNKTYYGELIDVSYTDFTTINSSKYKFQRIDNKRLRLELEIS